MKLSTAQHRTLSLASLRAIVVGDDCTISTAASLDLLGLIKCRSDAHRTYVITPEGRAVLAAPQKTRSPYSKKQDTRPLEWFEQNVRNMQVHVDTLKKREEDLQRQIARSEKDLAEIEDRINKARAAGRTHLPI